MQRQNQHAHFINWFDVPLGSAGKEEFIAEIGFLFGTRSHLVDRKKLSTLREKIKQFTRLCNPKKEDFLLLQ